MKESEFCLVFSLSVFQAMTAENVWPPRAQNVLVLRSPQFSFTFGPYVRASREFCMGIPIPCVLGDTKNTEGVPKSLGDFTRGCRIPYDTGMDLYRQYPGFSPASKGSAILSQSKHWSNGRRVSWTAPPPL